MGFFDFLRKPQTKAIGKYLGSATEEFVDPEAASKLIQNFVKTKAKRGAIGGGVLGGLGGAGLGYAHAKAYEDEGAIPLVGALGGALSGGLGGAMLGGVLRSAMAVTEAEDVVKRYNDATKHIFAKTPSGRYAVSPEVEEALFSDPDVRKRVLSDAFAVVKNDGTGEFLGRKIPEELYDVVGKEEALDELVRRARKAQKDGFSISSALDGVGEGVLGKRNAIPQIKNRVLGELIVEVEKKVPPGAVSSVIRRLRAEGITSSKEFARRYHPDVNQRVPKEIQENFGKILDSFRQAEKGQETAENVFSGFLEKQKEHIQRANQAIRGLK